MCQWNFMFELEFTDRKLELYSPTRIDRDKWVNIFQLICEMNDRGISVKQITPFEYQKRKQLDEDQKNTLLGSLIQISQNSENKSDKQEVLKILRKQAELCPQQETTSAWVAQLPFQLVATGEAEAGPLLHAEGEAAAVGADEALVRHTHH